VRLHRRWPGERVDHQERATRVEERVGEALRAAQLVPLAKARRGCGTLVVVALEIDAADLVEVAPEAVGRTRLSRAARRA
jgi:hypothetical protein